MNYKIINVLQQFNKSLHTKFLSLVGAYEKDLNTGPLIRMTGFTSHDAETHCSNIYRILSDVLPEQFYNEYKYGENIFVLCVSVFLHDFAMAIDVDEETRRQHSKIARDFVRNEIYNTEDTVMKAVINREYAEPVLDIIYAHSDIKDINGNIKHSTLQEIITKYDEKGLVRGQNEDLNVPFLASVLRLADELDLDYSRIAGSGYERKHNTEESKKHFERCEYFQRVRVNSNNVNQLVMETDANVLEKYDENKMQTVAAQVLSMYQKVCDEFEQMRQRVLFNTKYASNGIWNISSIMLIEEEKYRELIKKKENL